MFCCLDIRRSSRSRSRLAGTSREKLFSETEGLLTDSIPLAEDADADEYKSVY